MAFLLFPFSSPGNGHLVVATPQNPQLKKFGITMSASPFEGSVQVTTRANQELWFNKSPTFVSMHEIGDYIYLFFKEEAVETDEKVRVGSVCGVYVDAGCGVCVCDLPRAK